MAARVVFGIALVGISAGLQIGDSVDQVGSEAAAKAVGPRKDDSFMVYSLPKTGTTSLQSSLGLMMDPPCRVMNLDGVNAKRAVKCHSDVCARDFLSRRPKGSTTWLFSSVRSPFDQRMSAFFQGIFHEYSPEELAKEPISRLLEKFHSQVTHLEGRYFQRRWGVPFGINVTGHPFDFEKGYLRFKTEWQGRNLNIMILRLDLSAKWEKMIQEVLPTFKLVRSNVGEDKDYADKYRTFKNGMHWTDEEIAKMSLDETFQYFYKKAEAEAIVAKVPGGGRLASDGSIAEDFESDIEKDSPLPFC